MTYPNQTFFFVDACLSALAIKWLINLCARGEDGNRLKRGYERMKRRNKVFVYTFNHCGYYCFASDI